MRQHGLRARTARRYRVCTTDSKHSLSVAANLLDQNFVADQPNQVWLADITYIPTSEGWLYLAVILDLFTRKVVGWAMRDQFWSSRFSATARECEGYYNRQRRHSAIGYITPERAEAKSA